MGNIFKKELGISYFLLNMDNKKKCEISKTRIFFSKEYDGGVEGSGKKQQF